MRFSFTNDKVSASNAFAKKDHTMLSNKAASAVPWQQALAQETARPVFPRLPQAGRPYLLALLLFAGAATLTSAGDAALLRYGLSWPLVALLVVAAAASLWGVRPALLVLVLSVAYGTVVRLQIPISRTPPTWQGMVIRMALFAVCGAAAIWLVNRAKVMQGKAETRREVVMALQSAYLPTELAHASGYDLSGLYKPAREEEEVGGDFYDFYPSGAGQFCLVIGDVMGKGKEAAASTALLRYAVRAFCSAGASPAQIITQLNTLIETQGLPFETASLFVGLLEPHSGSLCYANAGHEPPLLKRTGGEEMVLAATGPILGVGLDVSYDEKAVALGSQDALLLMTDGVTEARNRHGEFLGSAGAWWMLRAALRAPSAQAAVASLEAALAEYISTYRCDDIALLLLRRT